MKGEINLYTKTDKTKCPFPIDIVYLWVDGSDKAWRDEKDKWYEKVNGIKPVYVGASGEERFPNKCEFEK